MSLLTKLDKFILSDEDYLELAKVRALREMLDRSGDLLKESTPKSFILSFMYMTVIHEYIDYTIINTKNNKLRELLTPIREQIGASIDRYGIDIDKVVNHEKKR